MVRHHQDSLRRLEQLVAAMHVPGTQGAGSSAAATTGSGGAGASSTSGADPSTGAAAAIRGGPPAAQDFLLPAELEPRRAQLLAELERAQGTDLDRAYLQQ